MEADAEPPSSASSLSSMKTMNDSKPCAPPADSTSVLTSPYTPSDWSRTSPRQSPLLNRPPNPRVYQVWPQVGGNNQFLCRGRCVTGPKIDLWYNCCAWSCILVLPGLYFCICGPRVYKIHWVLPAAAALFLLATIICLLLTSCTDPGIIPRHALQVAVNDLEREVASATSAPPMAVDAVTSEPVCVLTQEQDELGYRWCPTCKVVRPPRASHCRDCDNCVMRFDHHCPFVNNCVGSRNYAFFSAFLLSVACLCFTVILGVILFIMGESHISNVVLIMICGVIVVPAAFLVVVVMGLALFHVWLCCRGKTTREALTGKVTLAGRTLFRFRGPSLIHTRDRVTLPMRII
uniref:Palmitoyltransferase n=1 Tax=Noctiluca scintillans TaxID=2966 RepID=A0A7S1EVQ2_NOCSC